MTYKELHKEGCKLIENDPYIVPRYCFVSPEVYAELLSSFDVSIGEELNIFKIFLPTGYVELIKCQIPDYSFGV